MTSPNADTERMHRRGLWIPRSIAVVSAGLVINAVSEYVRGIPDSYHNEKIRSLLLAVALLVMNIAPEFRLRPIGWVLQALGAAAVIATFWFTFN